MVDSKGLTYWEKDFFPVQSYKMKTDHDTKCMNYHLRLAEYEGISEIGDFYDMLLYNSYFIKEATEVFVPVEYQVSVPALILKQIYEYEVDDEPF